MKIRILFFMGETMYYGGTESFIMNYYRHMDHNKIQIDFVYQSNKKGVFDDELISYGSQIYRVQPKFKHPFQYSKQIKDLLLSEKYNIVHSQMDAIGAWPLGIAKYVGVPIRIAHSHSTAHLTNNFIKKCVLNIAKIMLRKTATHFFACSKDAGKFMFGEKLTNAKKVKVIHNGIDLDSYAYSEIKRKNIRYEFGLTNDLVIGHIGRFREEKNHVKILSIFQEVLKKNTTAKLILVGNGPLERKIRKKVNEMKIENSVIFTGVRNDVCNILNAFDVFLFPSLFEGLSVVAIEAQANGLPCIFSKTLADETIISDLVIQKSLTASDKSWCKAIMKARNMGRKDCHEKLRSAGYDINTEARKLQSIYMKLAGVI